MNWTAISSLYNWVLNDPVLDWLDIHGEAAGFNKDTASPNYLPSADYGLFVRTLGDEFEERVLSLIRAQVDVVVVEGARSNNDAFYAQTLRLMNEGAHAIYQGLVRDPDLEVFGVPDLIIRGDALDRLAPGTVGDLPTDDYYALDIKFKGLELNKRGDLKSNHAWERIQLALYERALATMRRRVPTRAFVIGRRLAGDEGVGGGCFDAIPWVGQLDDKRLALVEEGLVWLSDLRENGARWSPLLPSDSRLYPNFKNVQDSPWHDAKKQLPSPTPREPWDGPHIQPARIEANRYDWHESRGAEFFVDFETFNAMNDDFSGLPAAGGRPMIFMIGCGHEEHGEWRFTVWTADEESLDAEGKIIQEWLAHMDSVRRAQPSGVERPLVFHWHNHEVKELEKAAGRHGRAEWLDVNWYDLLHRVFKSEPVRIVDTDGYSLKPVARKLREKGLIDTVWEDGPVGDGLAAMTAAWSCYAASRERRLPVHQALTVNGRSLMGDVEAYNEVDCKTMWEILGHLRQHH
ncbi:MAG: ribonuclease H-like domain-containing protein [Fimbriimonadaceae bacterium]